MFVIQMTVAVNVSASVAQRELAFANHLRSVMNSNDDDMMSLLALQLLQFSVCLSSQIKLESISHSSILRFSEL
jgi:hypothetical protein